MPLYHNEEEPEEQARNVRAVYFYVGQFLTQYQSIEDALLGVFSRALTGNHERAELIFAEAKGLESKLKLISAAMIGWEPNVSNAWDNLRGRIKVCFDQRNQVAHSTGVVVGRTIVLKVDEEKGAVEIAGYGEEHSQFKLQKCTKSGEVLWDEQMLREARDTADVLLSHIMGLIRRLDGEAVTQHLLQDWELEAVREWPTK